jgi:hypothetical protein
MLRQSRRLSTNSQRKRPDDRGPSRGFHFSPARARHTDRAGKGVEAIPEWVRNGGASAAGRTTWVLWKFYGGDEPLLPSGLLGPLRILVIN